MHEVSIMESALGIAEESARLHGATRIHSVTLRIGRLAGVEPEALELAFEVVTAGTLAEGAKLKIEATEVVCYCPDCQVDFVPVGFVFRCPRCGRDSRVVRQGRELELLSLEVSKDGNAD
jgi:hydrogenase nickel incorporation protein HypA/HybF